MAKIEQVRIVGIGASAGGLEAIHQFFENLSNDTGFAFVIIQHLSPDFKSLMNELLPKHTEMPVEVIENIVTPKANHIYLISSKQNLIIQNGVFKPVGRKPAPYLNLPIDIFFQSLGIDQKEKSIGIILSGSGTDGSKGVRTIKEHGGLVLAQDPETAQFRSMPEAAIALGFADSVLPPFALAMELGRIAELPFHGAIAIIDLSIEKNKNTLSRILSRVAELSGIDFNEYRKGTMLRRTEKRMMINNFRTLEDYYHYLLAHEEECKTLFKEFLIGVTRFFRDTEAFDLLRKKIIPKITKNTPAHRPIRIWVTGCSTGEEVYSIAILFLEHFKKYKISRPFKIFASDIDKEAIAFASAGIYHDNILADVSPELVSRYFINQQNIFRIKKIVREKVVFALHDALKDPPFMNIDLISCRNVLIYLNPKIQQNLIGNFQFALNFEGFMFLGPSESIGKLSSLFKVINSKWNLYQSISTEKVNMLFRGSARRGLGATGIYKVESDMRSLNKPTDYKYPTLLAKRFAPLALFVNEQFDILYSNGSFESILNLPRGFGKLNLLDMIGTNDPLIFKSGIRKVKEGKKLSKYQDFILTKEDKQLTVDIQFEPCPSQKGTQTIFLITFQIKQQNSPSKRPVETIIHRDQFSEDQLAILEQELEEVNREKQGLVEQLETANEELQSSNEELMTTNEELMAANEELQSVNEELYTVNTELQSKIDELEVANSDTSNLLKSTHIGTVFLDRGLRIRRFTPALKEQFDLLDGDIGRLITNFNHTFNDNKIFEDIAKVLKSLNTIEREIITKDGVHHLMRILPYRTEDNRVDGVVLTFINIEQLHQMTNKLKYKSHLFQAVFNNSTSHISIVDANFIIKDINFVAAGFTKEKVIGESILSFVPKVYQQKLKAIIRGIKKKEISVGNFEMETLLATGEKKWYQNYVISVHNLKEPHYIYISRDITSFKENRLHIQSFEEQQEQEIQQRVHQVIGQNQQLTDTNLFLEAFLEGALTYLDAHLKEETLVNLPTINLLLAKAKEVMDYQKDASKLLREIDAKAIFMEVKNALNPSLKATKAEIRYSFGQHRKLRYVKAHLYEIIYILLDNAIQYRKSDQPLTIQLSTQQKENFFILSVTDNGIGIDLRKQGHLLFKPFKRLTDTGKGLGLGLSMIDSLVRKTGGRIEVDSAFGVGSVFKVYIRV